MVKLTTRLTALAGLLFFIPTASYTQTRDLQELRCIIAEKQTQTGYLHDTSYIIALNDLAHAFYSVSADSVLLYANKALTLTKKMGYLKGESNASRQLGNGYRLIGDYVNMLAAYQQALILAEKTGDPRLLCKSLVNIAQAYVDMGRIDEALPVAERSKNVCLLANDSVSLCKSLSTIGEIWYQRKQYDKALRYYTQSAEMALSMKNERQYIMGFDQVGKVLNAKGQYREALPVYLHSFEYAVRTGDRLLVTMSCTMAATLHLELKEYANALKYGLLSYQEASRLGSAIDTKNACCVLSEIYKSMGDYRKALQYNELASHLSDTLSDKQMGNKVARLEAKFEYEKKEVLQKEAQARKDMYNESIVRTRELEIWFSVTVIVILSVLAFVQFRNSAIRKKTNRELAAMNDKITLQKEKMENQSYQLLLNNQQKDKLFSIISHDLKTPLHSLNTVLDLLKTQSLSEEQINRMIEELRKEVDYSSGLVRNLLLWSNSQLNGMVAKPVALNLWQLANEVVDLSKKQAVKKEIFLDNKVSPSLRIWADLDMIQVVIRNLADNAIKFCRPGDTITIDGRAVAGGIEICVSDTGIGIEQDILDKINRQTLVTTCGTAGEKGTGLGLLLCREFLELNKGRFSVESKSGGGSRFCIVLPAVNQQLTTMAIGTSIS